MGCGVLVEITAFLVCGATLRCVGVQQSGGAGSTATGTGGGVPTAGTSGGSGSSAFPMDGLSRHWHSLPPAGVPSRFHLATRFSLGSWQKALAWYREDATSKKASGGAASRVCDYDYARLTTRLENHGLPLSREEGDDKKEGGADEEHEGVEREGGRRQKMPAVCLSEAEMLKLSLSLSSCTSGQEGAYLSGGGGGRGDVLSSGHEGVVSGLGEGEGEGDGECGELD